MTIGLFHLMIKDKKESERSRFMKETLYLTNDLAIVNYSAGYAQNGDMLLNSTTFSNYVHNYIDYLKDTHEDLYYFALNGKTPRSDYRNLKTVPYDASI